VQVDPIKPILKPPEAKRLKPKCDVLHSTFAFKFNLRRYSLVLHLHRPPHHFRGAGFHGRSVQVDPMKPTLKAPGTKRLKLEHDVLLSSFAFNFNLRRYTMVSCCRPAGGLIITGRVQQDSLKISCQKPTHFSTFPDLNSVSGLVSMIWYRIPFDQSGLSISRIPPTNSLTVRPVRDPSVNRPSIQRR
jgi:hypothetical protein